MFFFPLARPMPFIFVAPNGHLASYDRK